MDGICGALWTLEQKCSPHPGLVASRGRLVGTECGASQSWRFLRSERNEDMTTDFQPCRGWNSTSGTSRDLGTFGGKLCSKGSLQMDWYFVFWKPFPRNDLQQKFRTLEVGVDSFRWRNQKRKEKGLQENLYWYLLRGGNLRHVLSVHPTSRRRSKPGGDERRTRALGHNRYIHCICIRNPQQDTQHPVELFD